MYNPFVLVEVNDIGEQHITLQYDMEYDNLIIASMRGQLAGTNTWWWFFWGKTQLGVRTTKIVKKLVV